MAIPTRSGLNAAATQKSTSIWSSMLDSVSSTARLPEKTLLVLGGTSETQRDFLQALSAKASSRRNHDRRDAAKEPPIANEYALGYTYFDVMDAEHEDVLARLSLYLLADSAPAFTPLLAPLLTPESIPHTLLVILLDWSQPWLWLRQLRDWIRLLRTVMHSLDAECRATMDELMGHWRDRGRGSNNLDGSGTLSEADALLPLGPGEWDEALGLPLLVVCQNADHIELLERERAWKEDEFDFVLQLLRTVGLKHGAGLLYTSPGAPGPLSPLVHACLGLQAGTAATGKKVGVLKANVVDRDKVLVPPNWDSWGKIRVLREGFDVEGISEGWARDIEGTDDTTGETKDGIEDASASPDDATPPEPSGALAIYEETIQTPSTGALQFGLPDTSPKGIEVHTTDLQTFLAAQLEVLEKLKEAEAATSAGNTMKSGSVIATTEESGSAEDGRVLTGAGDDRIRAHIGPVQFNMGGIQVDADDMLKRLKDRQAHQTPDPDAPPTEVVDLQQTSNFFKSLMHRPGGSATSSPIIRGTR